MELLAAARVSRLHWRAVGGLFFLAAEWYSPVQLSLRATGGVIGTLSPYWTPYKLPLARRHGLIQSWKSLNRSWEGFDGRRSRFASRRLGFSGFARGFGDRRFGGCCRGRNARHFRHLLGNPVQCQPSARRRRRIAPYARRPDGPADEPD